MHLNFTLNFSTFITTVYPEECIWIRIYFIKMHYRKYLQQRASSKSKASSPIFAFIFTIYYKFSIKDNTAVILVLVLHLNTKRKVAINLGNIIACLQLCGLSNKEFTFMLQYIL
jgi:hypothetical protein